MMSFKTGRIGQQIMRNKLSGIVGRVLGKKMLAIVLLVGAMFMVLGSALASDFSIRPVYFVEGRPSSHDKIDDSLIVSNESIEVLKNDASAVSILKGKFRVKVVGFTDNKECAGAECIDLSLRRARSIYSWMLAHGVSSTLLLPPEGRGTDDPLDDNNTSEGRARNRHVEFQMIPVEKK